MTDLRTAAQQALAALEEIADEVFSPYDNKLGDAILAIRSALAEPVQEPVAWMETENFVDGENLWDSRTTFNQQGNGTPLYTAPPHRKPLDDLAIADIYTKWDATPGTSMADFARAIERAHGIGDGIKTS